MYLHGKNYKFDVRKAGYATIKTKKAHKMPVEFFLLAIYSIYI